MKLKIRNEELGIKFGGGFAASGMGCGLQGRAMARPWAFMLPRGAAGWGIPPYGRPESDSRSFSPRARPGWPKT